MLHLVKTISVTFFQCMCFTRVKCAFYDVDFGAPKAFIYLLPLIPILLNKIFLGNNNNVMNKPAVSTPKRMYLRCSLSTLYFTRTPDESYSGRLSQVLRR